MQRENASLLSVSNHNSYLRLPHISAAEESTQLTHEKLY